ncbi:MAG: hypothetical protein LBQ32_10465 [Burkholderiaceae bacterium]|jgi:hypothetical protein|nr:hypothetical protein [Burkholderiaceae bacterium]
MNKTALHALAATVALLTVLTFLTATVVAELFFDTPAVAAVKHAIVLGLWLLIPALALTAGTGLALGRRRTGRLLDAKRRRMPFIALNGVLGLLPAALFLHYKAQAGAFDTAFYLVQGLELVLGAIQAGLLTRNYLAGIRLRTGRS